MKPINYILLGIFAVFQIQAQDPAIPYINTFAPIAIEEMERTGIPSSIKLAQAILESNYGQSDLSLKANNHFGIKCGSSWNGGAYFSEDDDKDHRGRMVESCFRAYESAEESFIAHSDFLKNNGKSSRYDFLFNYKSTDYKKWAYGLKKAGYATDPRYPQKLIYIIEKYELYNYDTLGDDYRHNYATTTSDFESERPGGKILNDQNVNAEFNRKELPDFDVYNGVKMFLTTGQESIHDIAEMYNLSFQELMAHNEGILSPYDKLSPKSRIYLEKKNINFKGRKKFHQVREGESMKLISQHYAIDLEALYIRNRMPFGSEPIPGETIQLKGLFRSSKKPDLMNKNRVSLADKSRFVEQTVEYIFAPKNAEKD